MSALSDELVLEHFGDPKEYVRDDGDVAPTWPQSILEYVAMPAPLPLGWDPNKLVTQIRCHRRIVPMLGGALSNVYQAGLWDKLRTFDGCYNWRTQRGSQARLSRHAWGIALDFDASHNRQGHPPQMPAAIVECFEREGFFWGGRFRGSRVDGMHFEASDVARLAP